MNQVMTASSPASPAIAQRALITSIALHLLPGALTTVAYVLIAPVVMARGFPALFGLLLAALLMLIPFELGYLYFQARQPAARRSAGGIVFYREPVPLWQYIAFALGFLAWPVRSQKSSIFVASCSRACPRLGLGLRC
jgi:uncharacterized protein